MTSAELEEEMRRLSRLIDSGVQALTDQSRALAEAENVYRKAKSEAWLVAPEGTVPEREAWVNGKTAQKRYARDLADGMRSAALEALRSRRTQLSALQTLMNAYQEEAKFSRTAPEVAA